MRKTILVCLLCAMLSLLLMLYAFTEPKTDSGAAPVYAHLVADDIGAEAMLQKQGIAAAALEAGVSVKTFTADPSADADAQLLSFLSGMRGDGMSGVILSPCGAETARQAVQLAGEMQIPIVCLWEDASLEGALTILDNEALGRALAESALEAHGRARFPVAVFCGTDAPGEQRLSGVTRALGFPFDVYRDIEAMHMLPEDTVVIALTAAFSEALAESANLEVWGVDPGDARAALLKSGKMRGIAFTMAYAEGYLAMEALIKAASGGGRAEAVACPVRVVVRETMHDSQNMKLMFPLLQ